MGYTTLGITRLLQWESRLPLFIDEGSSGCNENPDFLFSSMKGVVAYYVKWWLSNGIIGLLLLFSVRWHCLRKNEWMMQIMNWWSSRWAKKKHSCTDWFSLIEVIEAAGLINYFEHNQAIHRNVLSLSLSLSLSPDNSRTWLCTTLHILWWVVVTENNTCAHVYFMNSRLRLLILVRVTSIISCMWIRNPHNSLSKSSPKLA